MDEINKLKKPLKPDKEQIRKDLNPENVMKEFVDEYCESCETNRKGQLSEQDAKICILSWAEQILGLDPQEEMIVNMFEKITQSYLSKDTVLDYMRKLYQQAGVTGMLSKSQVGYGEEQGKPSKGETGQISDEDYSYDVEEQSEGLNEMMQNEQKSF